MASDQMTHAAEPLRRVVQCILAKDMAGLLGLHPLWAVVIVIIVLVLFGVGRLPGVGGALGRGIRDFKQNLRGDESDTPKPPSDAPKR